MPDSQTIRILCVHGVGHLDADLSWRAGWTEDIRAAIARWNPEAEVDLDFVEYDTFFEASRISPLTVAEALLRLTASGVVHGVGDALGRPRGAAPVSETIRWTAGMIAQWEADEGVRHRAEQAVAARIDAFDPDVVCAHSLGSLITYGLFAAEPQRVRNRTFVTLGSQIGNPFVRSVFGGRIVPLATAKHWFHLYNREDAVFTAEIRLAAANFEQVDAFFDIEGALDHDAREYLRNENAALRAWRAIATPGAVPRALERSTEVWSAAAAKVRRAHRALLVGINDYPDESNRLEGCVNDVFRMSEVLQELGLDPEDIRLCLNERATAKGVLERIAWLLEDARDGDVRVFVYSGHGAQIPQYGSEGEVDHKSECLVTYDFDWTPAHAIVDDQLVELYSQLPYGAQFVGILDCCHSGGMSRAGFPKARGVNPPDDIRHRELRWDSGREMWVPRKLKLAAPDLALEKDRTKYLGTSGATKRLGRGVGLWTGREQFERARKTYGKHKGGYTPIVLQACQENELAYEYRHGVAAFGAFTYALTTIFRQVKRQRPNFPELMGLVAERLHELGYAQRPAFVGAKAQLARPILDFGRKPAPKRRRRRT